MAQRRMFDIDFLGDDRFLDMPATTQLLYFHLGLRADDDGFLNNVKSIMRTCGGTDDDLKILIAKKFLIPFESGIVVIKHWKMHNKIPKDRYKETKFLDEKALLILDDCNSYTLCTQDVYNLDTQVRLGKVRLGEVRVVEGSAIGYKENDGNDNEKDENVDNSVDNSLEYMGGELGKGVVILTNAQRDALLDILGFDMFNHYVDKLSTFILKKDAKVGNHYQTILNWAEEDAKV